MVHRNSIYSLPGGEIKEPVDPNSLYTKYKEDNPGQKRKQGSQFITESKISKV